MLVYSIFWSLQTVVKITYSDMNIDWEAIRHFLVVAETGSLSAAASQLGSSQPTVGRRIDGLETTLGFKLFRRHARGLDLTHEGAQLLEQARQMLHGAANIQRLAAGDFQQPSGTVRLSLPEGLCHGVLLPAMGDFQARFPSIRLVLVVSSRTADLTHGEADIAIRLFRPREPDLVVKKLGLMKMGVYAGAEYLKGHPPVTKPAHLCGHRCIGYGDDLGSLAENRWLLDHCGPENVVIRTDSTSSRLQATEENLGVSIQPCFLGDRNRSLVRLVGDADLPGHEIWLTYHRDLGHSIRTRAVTEFLPELFAAFAEE